MKRDQNWSWSFSAKPCHIHCFLSILFPPFIASFPFYPFSLSFLQHIFFLLSPFSFDFNANAAFAFVAVNFCQCCTCTLVLMILIIIRCVNWNTPNLFRSFFEIFYFQLYLNFSRSEAKYIPGWVGSLLSSY